MTESTNVKNAVRSALEKSGALEEIRGRVRAEVFHALNDSEDTATAPPKLSGPNVLINELIREYMESGQPEDPLSRAFLASQLKLKEDSATRAVPLLYTVIDQIRRLDEK